jgi:hypothetical protein
MTADLCNAAPSVVDFSKFNLGTARGVQLDFHRSLHGQQRGRRGWSGECMNTDHVYVTEVDPLVSPSPIYIHDVEADHDLIMAWRLETMIRLVVPCSTQGWRLDVMIYSWCGDWIL